MQDHESFRVSVVVPVYNGAATVAELVARTRATLASRAPFEILLVNDGSRDESWKIIRSLGDAYPEVRGFDLLRNYGQQNALLTGITAARGTVIVTIDDDLEDRPEDIPLLVDALEGGFDVAFGVPEQRRGGLFRRTGAALGRLLVSRLTPHRICGTSFRAFRAALRDGFGRAQSPFLSLDVLLTWAMARAVLVPVTPAPRSAKSRYRLTELPSVLATGVTGISLRPLHLATALGALTALAGAVLGVFALASPAPGRLVLSGVLVVGGLQCLLLGVLGAYVGRIYFLSLGLPMPVVKNRVGG